MYTQSATKSERSSNVRSVERTDYGKNTYGSKGYYALTPQMIEAAKHYGLHIEHNKDGSYNVRSSYGAEALSDLVEPFVPAVSGETITVNRPTLKSILEFLHQPVQASIQKRVQEQRPEYQPNSLKERVRPSKDIQGLVEEKRRLVHHVLRMAATGNPEIPEYIDPELAQEESSDCHASAENNMKEEREWAFQSEWGNTGPQADTSNDIVSAIPATRYDPARGFVMTISPEFLSGKYDGKAQNKLQDLFWEALDSTTSGRYERDKTSEIVLNAHELKTFCAKIYEIDDERSLSPVVEQALYEGSVQECFAQIKSDAADLKGNIAFQRALAHRGISDFQDQKLADLLQTTTALTPLLTSQTMRDLWARHKATGKFIGLENPVDELTGELSRLHTVLSDYQVRGDITPEEMQAIGNRFSPVLSFLRQGNEYFIKSIEKHAKSSIFDAVSSQKTKERKIDENKKLAELRNVFQNANSNIDNAAMIGGFTIDKQFLDEDLQEMLELMRKGLKIDGNLAIQLFRGGVNDTLEWLEDMAKVTVEKPETFALFAILAYFASQAAMASLNPGADLDLSVLQDLGIPEVALDSQNKEVTGIYREAGKIKNEHFHRILPKFVLDQLEESGHQVVASYLQYKSYIGYDFIAGWTYNILNKFPFGETFMKSAYDASIEVADQFTFWNVIQNAAPHVGIVLLATKMGFERGMSGYKHLLNLSAPIVDTVVNMGKTVAETSRLKKNPHYDRQLFNQAYQALALQNLNGQATKDLQSYTAFERNAPLSMSGYTEALSAQKYIEDEVAAEYKEARLSLKAGWQRKDFMINGEVVTPLVQALRELDVMLGYTAERMGVDKGWDKQHLQDRLKIALEAAQEYKRTGDAAVLQEKLADNLDHLIGAQIRHTGHSSIYTAIKDTIRTKDHKATQQTMKRFYGSWVGHEKRKKRVDALVRNDQQRGGLQKIWDKTAKAGLIWAADKIVLGGQAAREAFHLMPAKKELGVAFGAACLMGTGYDALSAEKLVDNDLVNSVMNEFAKVSAKVTGTGGAISLAAIYNYLEDKFIVHTAFCTMALGGGTALKYTVKSWLRPLVLAGKDALSDQVKKVKETLKKDSDHTPGSRDLPTMDIS